MESVTSLDELQVPSTAVGRISDFYRPWEHQESFHLNRAKNRLQVGSFGSGKSKPLLMEAVFHCLEFPGCNCIILRKTIPDLKRTVIDKFKKDVPKWLYERGSQELGTYNETDHIVYFPPVKIVNAESGKPEIVQSLLYFAACERIQDVSKFLSTEYMFIGFEELGEFPYAIYDALAGRNRSTIPGGRPCMAAATNPMGIGWSWIKKLFVDHKPLPTMDKESYEPSDYWYIHSTVDNNPILIKDKEYVRTLEKSPLRDKIRWGKLNSVTGQYFGNWEPERHVLPRTAFTFHAWHPTWIGWDYGFGHWAAIVFFTKATLKPRFEGEKERTVNVAIREILLHETEPADQAKALISAIPRLRDKDGVDTGYAETIESIHFSWERFNRTVSNRTVADEVTDLLTEAGLPGVVRSNSDRVAGWTKMHSMLDDDEWFVLQGEGGAWGCPVLAEAIPMLVRGDGITCSMEDVVKPKGVSQEDDIGDACRYAVAGVLLDEGEKPKEQLLRERLAGIKDPVARAVATYKNYNEERALERRGPKQVIVPSWVNKVR